MESAQPTTQAPGAKPAQHAAAGVPNAALKEIFPPRPVGEEHKRPMKGPFLTDPKLIVQEIFRGESMDLSLEEGNHIFNEYLATTAVIQGAFPSQRDLNAEEFKQYFRALKHAMPDLNTVLYDVTQGEGTSGKPIVWARFTKLGRFSHPFFGLPATGLRVSMQGVLVARFTTGGEGEGRPIVDFLEIYQDNLSTMESMGVKLNLQSILPASLLAATAAAAGGGGTGASSSSSTSFGLAQHQAQEKGMAGGGGGGGVGGALSAAGVAAAGTTFGSMGAQMSEAARGIADRVAGAVGMGPTNAATNATNTDTNNAAATNATNGSQGRK